jgi:hypothetical protein
MNPKTNHPPSSEKRPPPTQEQITQRAHRLWIEEGRPEGRHREHWEKAEAQLRAGSGPLSRGEVEADKRIDGLSPAPADKRSPKGENL